MSNLEHNAIKMIEKQLEASIKDAIIKELENKLVDEFRKKAREEIVKAAESVTLKGVESMTDFLRYRDELVVYLRVNDEINQISKDAK